MKILINTPDISLLGGVANHYKGLKEYWTEDVRYHFVGGRKGIPGPLLLPFDYVKFFFICLFSHVDVIVLNPSLGKTAIKRDALFLKIAKWFRKKVVVFFHGWNPAMVSEIDQNNVAFKAQFNRADLFLVLASSFKTDLQRWGIEKPIVLTTTKVDNQLIKQVDITTKQYDQNLLFLTRIEEYKGIFIALELYKTIKSKFPNTSLTIAGDGSKMKEVKKYVEEHRLDSVTFTGYVEGDQLIKAFQHASIYIFPSYSEGMPTSVLEAMAFGLPVITRPVGGLVDFFENDKMGCMIDSLDSTDFVQPLEELLADPSKMREMGYYNHEYAKQHFMASEVAKSLETIFRNEQ